MKNIHILPTGKPSRLKQNKITKKYSLATKGIDLTMYTPQNIYITSDEYIGLSYYLDGNLVRKGVVDDKEYWEVRKDYKKIILTTDQDLIKDGVQAIDDEFLEWFVKNPSCEEVEIEDISMQYHDEGYYEYKIIIPKEEPKQHVEFINNNIDQLDKAIESFKQETLEEVAEKYAEHQLTGIYDKFSKFECINDFIAGAKWQQEQDKKRYSEEEVRKISLDFFYHWWNAKGSNTEQGFDKWFEQVKKK
jgi:hypothetical protein